ncbi:glutathione peroxidase [Paenibacillus thermotolerans]|uniref:glutathione peroxidase n=1 Tax=Paenibacillus thermotolerans TaxID=3027807 RepID=UPI0023687617|nr:MULTISPECIES: glutathione peroxidase [unclassified Paenibacillus]
MSNGFYDLQAKDAKGNERGLSEYKGNVLLVVNVASQCGFTPQYAGLEQLYREYKDRGFRIAAFPSNDFGAQEPGTIKEIERFCSVNYGVTFDLFDKVKVLGEDNHEVYRFLTANAPETGDVKWNFEKFLIGKDGQVKGRYSSQIAPEDRVLREAIERELNA